MRGFFVVSRWTLPSNWCQHDFMNGDARLHVGNIKRGLGHVFGLDRISQKRGIKARALGQQRGRDLGRAERRRANAILAFLIIQA